MSFGQMILPEFDDEMKRRVRCWSAFPRQI